MKSQELIDLFKRMYREKWKYVLNKAEEGCVDCSGAFVWAFKQFGQSIEHGSNSIYHKRIGSVQNTPVAGYAAFKIKDWTSSDDNKWKSKSKFNVYHIGLVDETGKYVLNAKGTDYGFCRDKSSTFDAFAPLIGVDYGGNTMFGNATCTGDGVRVRVKPNGEVIGHYDKGDRFTVLNKNGEWFAIAYEGDTAYISANFVKVDDAVSTSDTKTPLKQYLLSVYADGSISQEIYRGGDSLGVD